MALAAYKREYINVVAEFTKDGQILPMSFFWTDGKEYEVDRILNIRKATALKAGGHGMRYTCRILGKERQLFLEDGGRWFVEQRVYD